MIVEDYKGGMKLRDICEKYKISLVTAYNRLKKRGIVPNRDNRGNPFTNDEIIYVLTEYFLKGKPQYKIALELNRCEVSVRNYLKVYKKEVYKIGAERVIANLKPKDKRSLPTEIPDDLDMAISGLKDAYEKYKEAVKK